MYNSANIAERIKDISKKRNVSVRQLLTDVGLGGNTMANMKTSMPKSDTLARIADYLDCSVDYLLGRVPPAAERGGVALSEREALLLEMFSGLNELGQEKLLEYADDLTDTGKYKKHSAGGLEARGA